MTAPVPSPGEGSYRVERVPPHPIDDREWVVAGPGAEENRRVCFETEWAATAAAVLAQDAFTAGRESHPQPKASEPMTDSTIIACPRCLGRGQVPIENHGWATAPTVKCQICLGACLLRDDGETLTPARVTHQPPREPRAGEPVRVDDIIEEAWILAKLSRRDLARMIDGPGVSYASSLPDVYFQGTAYQPLCDIVEILETYAGGFETAERFNAWLNRGDPSLVTRIRNGDLAEVLKEAREFRDGQVAS